MFSGHRESSYRTRHLSVKTRNDQTRSVPLATYAKCISQAILVRASALRPLLRAGSRPSSGLAWEVIVPDSEVQRHGEASRRRLRRSSQPHAAAAPLRESRDAFSGLLGYVDRSDRTTFGAVRQRRRFFSTSTILGRVFPTAMHVHCFFAHLEARHLALIGFGRAQHRLRSDRRISTRETKTSSVNLVVNKQPLQDPTRTTSLKLLETRVMDEARARRKQRAEPSL